MPETEEAPNHFAFSVRHIAVRVASLDDKDFLLALNPAMFFTEPHYNGFPAVLARLPAVTVRELKPIITDLLTIRWLASSYVELPVLR